MAEDQPVRILSPTEFEALTTELQALIDNLPSSLPLIVHSHESRYGSLIGFSPDPELVEDRGEVGAVNTALERMFGLRMDGLKILERGTAIAAVVPLLEQYLKTFPGDIILQKWLTDLVSSARTLIQIKQWYSLLDSVTGRLKRREKAKPVAEFRVIKSIFACTTQPPPTPAEALPVALNDEGGVEWLSEEALAQSRADRLAGCDAPYAHNHLEFVDL